MSAPITPEQAAEAIDRIYEQELETLKREVRLMLRAKTGRDKARCRFDQAWSNHEVRNLRVWLNGWSRAFDKHRAEVERLIS